MRCHSILELGQVALYLHINLMMNGLFLSLSLCINAFGWLVEQKTATRQIKREKESTVCVCVCVCVKANITYWFERLSYKYRSNDVQTDFTP